MMDSDEVYVNIEAVRVPAYRENFGDLAPLGEDIATEGLRHPIALWKDGTLISGGRRLRTHFLLSGVPEGSQYRKIRAVFVDTIEDAAKRLLIDNEDDRLALTLKSVEMCRLWETLRQLDEPAAVLRAEAARRRGVELRKATMAGKREPARSGHSTDYVLGVLGPAFGISESSASRLWAIYMLASAPTQPEKRREQARQAMRNIDDGISSLWANYSALFAGNKPPIGKPRPAPSVKPAAAAKQRLAWERSLPQLEGLIAGLSELGPPNLDHDPAHVAAVRARLAESRRSLEKIINQMKKESVA